MKNIKWEYIEDVQILYKEQFEDTFTIVNLL